MTAAPPAVVRRHGRLWPSTYLDADGALWTMTATCCTVCGWPVDRFTFPTHPNCKEETS